MSGHGEDPEGVDLDAASGQWAEAAVMRDLERLPEPEPEPEPVPPPAPSRSWILERRPDGIVVDLARHRGARLVPARFCDHPVQVPRPLADTIVEWAAVPGACLYFTGAVGRGKTQLAWVAALARMDKAGAGAWPADLAYFAVPHLFEELRRSFDQRGCTDIVDRCVRARLLFLDDFGAEKVSEWTRERMLEIVNERYDHKRPVIVTSNLAPAELEAAQEPRLVSRLTQMCEGGKFAVHAGGADRRRPGG